MSANCSTELYKAVDTFKGPYLAEATPYHLVNFHKEVTAYCTESRTASERPKVIKALLIGGTDVGKGKLFQAFCHKSASIGLDFETAKFCVLTRPVALQIWDTVQSTISISAVYRGADIIIVVFDLRNEQSLEHTVRWMEEACSHAKEHVRFLVGTGKDLLDPSAYNEIEKKAVEYSHKLEAEFWAVSWNKENVENFFIRALCVSFNNSVLRELHSDKSANKQVDGSTVHIQQSPLEKQKKSCSS